jgi:hypothetical protein
MINNHQPDIGLKILQFITKKVQKNFATCKKKNKSFYFHPKLLAV